MRSSVSRPVKSIPLKRLVGSSLGIPTSGKWNILEGNISNIMMCRYYMVQTIFRIAGSNRMMMLVQSSEIPKFQS